MEKKEEYKIWFFRIFLLYSIIKEIKYFDKFIAENLDNIKID